MYKYAVFRENEDAIDSSQGHDIGTFDNELSLALYIETLDQDVMWLYCITEWFIGHNGNWPEDKWEYNETWRANEWLENYEEI